MKKAVTIAVNGDIKVVEFDEETEYEVLRKGLEDGYLEAVTLPDGSILWCDEEGKLKGLPLNPIADAVAFQNAAIGRDDVIVGPVVITGGPDAEGYPTTAPEWAFRIKE